MLHDRVGVHLLMLCLGLGLILVLLLIDDAFFLQCQERKRYMLSIFLFLGRAIYQIFLIVEILLIVFMHGRHSMLLFNQVLSARRLILDA